MQLEQGGPISFPRAKWRVSLTTLLAAALLCLRIPFWAGIVLLKGRAPDWAMLVFDIGTYLLTLAFLWVERSRLADYHITPLALILILAAKPLMPLMLYLMGADFAPNSFPRPVSFSYLALALLLVLALKLSGWSWKTSLREEARWLAWGSLAGLVLALVTGVPSALTLRSSHTLFGPSMAGFLSALIRIPQQLGYAAVTEEPVFRGFLWGILRKKGWRDAAILLFQAFLFLLGHAYYLRDLPLTFWISIPIGGLALGALAWRSRTITASLAAHTMVNAFGVFFGQIIGLWVL